MMKVITVAWIVANLTMPRNVWDDPDPLLPGWHARKRISATDVACANRSDLSWRLTLDGAVLHVANASGVVEEQLPFQVEVSQLGVPPRSARRVLATEDGWLVGYDAGEFGGSLWWLSADGERRTRLSSENVRALVNTGGRHLAFVGLSHGSVDEGKVLHVSRLDGSWRVAKATDLPGAPKAAVGSDDGSVLVVTTIGLVRLTSADEVVELAQLPLGGLYPVSIVEAQGGFYIGMRLFILRVRDEGGGQQADWFVPPDCPYFERMGDACRCRLLR